MCGWYCRGCHRSDSSSNSVCNNARFVPPYPSAPPAPPSLNPSRLHSACNSSYLRGCFQTPLDSGSNTMLSLFHVPWREGMQDGNIPLTRYFSMRQGNVCAGKARNRNNWYLVWVATSYFSHFFLGSDQKNTTNIRLKHATFPHEKQISITSQPATTRLEPQACSLSSLANNHEGSTSHRVSVWKSNDSIQ